MEYAVKRYIAKATFLVGLFFFCWLTLPSTADQPDLSVAPNDLLKTKDDTLCLNTDKIQSYRVHTDKYVTFTMTNNRAINMRLKGHCQQLKFHAYFSYTPTNGFLCAKEDEIKTRAGLPCQIESFETDNHTNTQDGSR